MNPLLKGLRFGIPAGLILWAIIITTIILIVKG